MRITRLKLTNFKCFEDLDLEFDDGITVIYGVNGSGKSSILQAIYFALYGSDALSGRLNSVITKGERDLTVELWFAHGGDEYHIKRKLRDRDSGTSQDASLDGPSVVRDGASDVDDYVESLFRMDSEAFTNCSYVRQEDATKLIEASPSKRQDMIDDLLQIGVLETYREHVHNATLGASNALDAKREVVSNLKSQLESHEGENYESELEEVRSDLDQLGARLNDLKTERDEEKGHISDIDSDLQELNDKESELEEIRGQIEDAEANLSEANSEVEGLSTEISGLRNQQSNLESAITSAASDADPLPFDSVDAVVVDDASGEDKYDDSTPESIKNALESDLSDLREEKSEKARERDKLEGEADRLRDKADSKEDNVEGLEGQISEKEEQIDRIDGRIEELEGKTDSAESEISALTDNFEGEGFSPETVEESHKEVVGNLETVSNEMAELAGKQTAKKEEISEAEDLVEQGRCPECGQEIEDESHLDLQEMRKSLGQIQGELNELQEKKSTLEERETELSELVANADRIAELRDEISRWEDDIEEKKVERGRHSNRISDLKEKIKSLEVEAEELREDAKTKDSAAEDAAETVSDLESEITSLESDIEAVNTVIDRIDGVSRVASQMESKAESLNRAKELVAERESRLNSLCDERDGVLESIDTSRLRGLQHERARHERRLHSLNSEIDSLEAERDRLNSREGELSNAVSEVRSLRNQKQEAEHKVTQLESFVEQLQDVEDMYSDLRQNLRKQNVGELRRMLNDLFTRLYQNDSYSKVELTNDYELTIYEKGGETLAPEQLSGGEKVMFNLSLRCAIYQLLTEGMEGEAPLPPLILDEPTANLDKGHVEQIPEVVNMVRDLGIDQTLVVSHNEEVVSSADEKIRVETKDTSNRSKADKDTPDPMGL